ncbi:hypothetical protein K490DRAFT_55675 [Saccharata proteae CBS 121410]|uniref:Uncharacterized protein n=1 Tax=Saccharata proteae CBS 121410 TaxID=1314787 RepID=A0A6A5YE31_9PEZI|nr:hypothetical protein K490DRAFT_55675 [Saccharata proteae CBS 121410]
MPTLKDREEHALPGYGKGGEPCPKAYPRCQPAGTKVEGCGLDWGFIDAGLDETGERCVSRLRRSLEKAEVSSHALTTQQMCCRDATLWTAARLTFQVGEQAQQQLGSGSSLALEKRDPSLVRLKMMATPVTWLRPAAESKSERHKDATDVPLAASRDEQQIRQCPLWLVERGFGKSVSSIDGDRVRPFCSAQLIDRISQRDSAQGLLEIPSRRRTVGTRPSSDRRADGCSSKTRLQDGSGTSAAGQQNVMLWPCNWPSPQATCSAVSTVPSGLTGTKKVACRTCDLQTAAAGDVIRASAAG